MAKEQWTVFYAQQDAGNQKPVNGWTEKQLKVQKLKSATALEKNEPAPFAALGKFATCEVQRCNFVTVVAESAEEACLVVDRFLSQGVGAEAGGEGPSVKSSFVNAAGKAVACLSSNLTEVAVL